MNDRLNAIILDGEMYVLTKTLGNGSDCASCALRDRCDRENDSYICSVFDVTMGSNFQHAERMVQGEQTIDRHMKVVTIYK